MAKRYGELADALEELSLHYRLEDKESVARDYQIASSEIRTAEDLPPDPAELDYVSNEVRDTIAEWRSLGEIDKLTEFREKRPYLKKLTQIAKIGPKRAQTINDETGATNIEDVRELDDNDELENISGIGPKTATSIRRSIAQL